MSLKYFVLLTYITCLVSNTLNGQEDNWSLRKDKDGIKVYTRSHPESSIQEFQAVCKVKTDMPALKALLSNVEGSTEWISDLKEAKLLKEIGNGERLEYYVVDMPWPFNDRDMVLHTLTNDTLPHGRVEVQLSSRHSYIPEKDGLVRITKTAGSWTFIPQRNNDTVRIIYHFFADPAGNVPAWVANMFIVDGPYQTLKNLKALVKKG